jgi:hypothetical protein
MIKTSEKNWLKDIGAASDLTHGSAYQWPWFETAAPPYDRMCPICYDEREPRRASPQPT